MNEQELNARIEKLTQQLGKNNWQLKEKFDKIPNKPIKEKFRLDDEDDSQGTVIGIGLISMFLTIILSGFAPSVTWVWAILVITFVSLMIGLLIILPNRKYKLKLTKYLEATSDYETFGQTMSSTNAILEKEIFELEMRLKDASLHDN